MTVAEPTNPDANPCKCSLCRPGCTGHVGDERPVCEGCRRRLRQVLLELPAMYDGLERELTAGSGNKAPRVSGSREAPIPGRLDVLNLRGPGSTHPRGHCDDQIGATPVFAALETWERDWRDLRGWAVTGTWPDLRTALGAIVRFLDAHLDWAADEHPAFDEFAAEVRAVHAAMRVAREGREPVVVVGPCPAIVDGVRCGSMLRMLARADVVKCRACGQSWEWEHFPSLATAIDQAERKSA